MSTVLLEARNIRKTYKGGHTFFTKSRPVGAVDKISVSVVEGETLGVIGESGSGKSTLGRLFLGLENPSHGKVFFQGSPMPILGSTQWRILRTSMQLVFQDPLAALDRRLTIGDQIREPLDIHAIGSKEERYTAVIKVLRSVGLRENQYRRYPHELSGGQRQRVVIARALIMQPQLIVCDEPVSALDVSIQAQIINILRDIQETNNLTIVFISHDLKVVRNISDRVAVMYLGRIVEIGESSKVFQHPQHPYTKALISSVPMPGRGLDDRVVLQGEPPNPADRPNGCAFHPRCPRADGVCEKITPELTSSHGVSVACHHLSRSEETVECLERI